MLIHLGNNEFIDLKRCVTLLNLVTISRDFKEEILSRMGETQTSEIRTAILTVSGKWLGSTLSTETLVHRGGCQGFPGAVFRHPKMKKMVTP